MAQQEAHTRPYPHPKHSKKKEKAESVLEKKEAKLFSRFSSPLISKKTKKAGFLGKNEKCRSVFPLFLCSRKAQKEVKKVPSPLQEQERGSF